MTPPAHDPFHGTGLPCAAKAMVRGRLAEVTTPDDLLQDAVARVLHSHHPLDPPLLRKTLQSVAIDHIRYHGRRPCTAVDFTEVVGSCDARGSRPLWADGSREYLDPLERVLADESAHEHAARLAVASDRLGEAVAVAGVTPREWRALHAAKFPEHRSRPYTGADRRAASVARRKLASACDRWLEDAGLTNRRDADPPVENVLAEAGLLRPDGLPETR